MTELNVDGIEMGDDAIITSSDPSITGYQTGFYQDMIAPHVGARGRIAGLRHDNEGKRWLWIAESNKNATFWLPAEALCVCPTRPMDLETAKRIVNDDHLATIKSARRAIDWLIERAERLEQLEHLQRTRYDPRQKYR